MTTTSAGHCANYNHFRSDPPVRRCPTCGEIVNAQIRAIRCGDEEHTRLRRDGDLFCTHCAEPLRVP